MDELDSRSSSRPDAAAAAAAETTAGDSDANGPAAVASSATIATTMASSSVDGPTRIPSVEFDVSVGTVGNVGSIPDSSSAAPLSWIPAAAAPAAASAGSRSTETREVHHVTFAEPCNKYVHSDSGIVLSPDETDANDVIVDGQSTELTDDDDDDDDDCDEATGAGGQQSTDSPAAAVRCPAPTNALPGPPIIKLHRCRSNESQDNPFLFDGELRRKADYIIAHSTILRTYVRIADPDQIPALVDQEQESTSDVQHPVTEGDTVAAQAPELTTAGLTLGEGQAVASRQSPSVTPQRVTSKELTAPVRNGEAEEPLLVRKKEGVISLESSPKKHATRSKKQICCVVQ